MQRRISREQLVREYRLMRRSYHLLKRMDKIILTFIVLFAAAFSVVAWETYTNTLSYQLRDCAQTTYYNGLYGFTCKNGDTYFVPASEK